MATFWPRTAICALTLNPNLAPTTLLHWEEIYCVYPQKHPTLTSGPMAVFYCLKFFPLSLKENKKLLL